MNVERRTAIIDKRADAVLFRLSAFVMMVVMMVFMLVFMFMLVLMFMVLVIVVPPTLPHVRNETYLC